MCLDASDTLYMGKSDVKDGVKLSVEAVKQ